MEYAKKSVRTLQENLCLTHEKIDVYYPFEDETTVEFELPFDELRFLLRKGFWQIESGFQYSQLFDHCQGDLWLRNLTFDIAKALGKNEAWFAEEYYTDNCAGLNFDNIDFERWHDFVKKKFDGSIPELNAVQILSCDGLTDYLPVYHDAFADCRDDFDKLQKRLGELRLLGLDKVHNNYRCEKEGQYILLNSVTLRPVIEIPYDKIIRCLNGEEMVVVQGDKSAVFDASGKPLTDFVTGSFKWRWIDYPYREIYNEEAGISITV